MAGKYLGALLMEKGLLTDGQVSAVLSRQMGTGLPFGQLAVDMFGLRMTDVWRALARQHEGDVERVDLSREVHDEGALAAVPARFAWASRVLPLRYDGATLVCVTTTRALPDAMAALCQRLDCPVKFVVAEELQVKQFIMQRYPMWAA